MSCISFAFALVGQLKEQNNTVEKRDFNQLVSLLSLIQLVQVRGDFVDLNITLPCWNLVILLIYRNHYQNFFQVRIVIIVCTLDRY